VTRINIFTSKLGFVLALLMVTAHTARPDSIVPVDPSATYLLTNNDPGAEGTAPINLALLGLQPGDHVIFQALGDLCYYAPDCSIFNVPPPTMVAVFSTNSTLLSSGLLNRIPGAIGGVGTPVFTGPTFYGHLSTDISQDFVILHAPDSTDVTIPPGAAFLFVSIGDSLYGDNVDPDQDLALGISHVAEPSSLIMLSCGFLSLLLLISARPHPAPCSVIHVSPSWTN
jgi:hypothetical protein